MYGQRISVLRLPILFGLFQMHKCSHAIIIKHNRTCRMWYHSNALYESPKPYSFQNSYRTCIIIQSMVNNAMNDCFCNDFIDPNVYALRHRTTNMDCSGHQKSPLMTTKPPLKLPMAVSEATAIPARAYSGGYKPLGTQVRTSFFSKIKIKK